MVLVVDHTLVMVSRCHGVDPGSSSVPSTVPPHRSTTGSAVEHDRHRGSHVEPSVEVGGEGVAHRARSRSSQVPSMVAMVPPQWLV